MAAVLSIGQGDNKVIVTLNIEILEFVDEEEPIIVKEIVRLLCDVLVD
jgi:hypothetical protein